MCVYVCCAFEHAHVCVMAGLITPSCSASVGNASVGNLAPVCFAVSGLMTLSKPLAINYQMSRSVSACVLSGVGCFWLCCDARWTVRRRC